MQGEQEQRAPSLHVGKCDVGKDAARSLVSGAHFATCCSVAPRPCHVGDGALYVLRRPNGLRDLNPSDGMP